MISVSKRKKVMIAAAVTIALTLMIALPYVGYAAPSEDVLEQGKLVVLKARGVALERVDNQTVTMPANMTLLLEPVKRYWRITVFRVVNGTVEVDGTSYAIIGGRGFVVHDRHALALQAWGTGPEGQTVTLKLVGRYFWMWGHVYVARLLGVLQIDDTRLFLILRAALLVP